MAFGFFLRGTFWGGETNMTRGGVSMPKVFGGFYIVFFFFFL